MAGLQSDYERALGGYLRQGDETALKQAYEFGRRALAEGHGILDMVVLYQGALEAKVRENPNPDVVRRAGAFFVETMSPFEMTHRAFGEANATLRRLNEALEGETRRIARALHDESGQLLAAVHIQLQDAARDLPAVKRGRIREVETLLEQIEEQLRHFSHELRPAILDDYGLVPALQSLAEKFTKRFGTPATVDGKLGQRSTATLEAAMYRVAQEALNNIARHAKASRVNIQLWQNAGEFHCCIRDDGVGFDPASLGTGDGSTLGLQGMRERIHALGGTLQVKSAPQKGTEIQITVPMEA
ncbi:MAG TPA: ATP-binding protein [Candidatus Angelobacter sp.]|nr:ATP-binding protein [Candidatus Angelobacter sp.]